MSERVAPFHRNRCLAAAAPAGKAKLTHPGKAILAGKLNSSVIVVKGLEHAGALPGDWFQNLYWTASGREVTLGK